jgi:hypothetical protein
LSSLRIRAGLSIIMTLHPVSLAAAEVFACIRVTLFLQHFHYGLNTE